MTRRRRSYSALALPLAAAAAYVVIAGYDPLWRALLQTLFPDESRVVYEHADMLALVIQHVELVAISSALSVFIGVALGVFVTRPSGSDYFDTVADLANVGQTFPPIAVLTLAVPLLGFGFAPTIFALTVYGVLPVLQNTIAGLRAVPESISESAAAMGMAPLQVLWRAELPIATPIIFAGARVSVVVNVATATIGAAIGAGGLGQPIISGLVNQDPAITLQGGLLAAGLALVLDGLLSATEKLVGRTVSSRI